MAHTPHSSFTRRDASALLAAIAFAAGPALAQDTGMLEEIIVVATKVEANVQDIPVAVTAITGDDIQEAGIKDVFDLQQYAPGLIVGQSQTATTSNFSIRGIGTSSNNFGLESSVGLYVDGVYRSRQSSMINDLVDVLAVEVLRGPQGTLFGKNTPQGAINMRTVAPSDEPNAFVEVSAGDFGLTKISAATNFSLSDEAAMRATVFSTQRDGYVSDLTFGEDVYNDRDRFGARLQLAYTPNDRLDLRIIADYAEIDEVCCIAVSRVDSIFANSYTDPNSPIPGGLVPGTDFVVFGLGGTVFSQGTFDAATIGLLDFVAQQSGLPGGGTIIGNSGFDGFMVALNQLPRSQNEDAGLSVELNYDLDNDMTLTSITAYRTFDTDDSIDADFTNLDLLERINRAQQSSFSEELRLSGQIGDRGTFVTGLYYFTQEIDVQRETNGGPFLQPYVLAVQPDLVALINGVNAVSAGSGGALPSAAAPFPIGSFADDDVRQDQDSWAVFGQVDLPMGEDWLLTLGARYTDESKDMTAMFMHGAQGPAPDLDLIALHLFYAQTNDPRFNPAVLAPTWQPGWGTYLFDPLAPRPDLTTQLEDDQFSGTAKLSWFTTDDIMVYLSYASGYKSGGTNTDRINVTFDPIFGPETSDTIELGVKADFPDQGLRVNFAIYDTQIDGLQANSFTGTGFNLQNAGKADTSGFEFETWWQATDSLGFQAYWVHSDAKYDVFENGTCWDAWVFHTGQPDPNAGGDIDAVRCPRSGGRLAYNPEDIAYLSFVQEFQLGANMSAYVRGEYSYYSETLTDGDLDPFTKLEEFDLVNARLGLRWENINAELTVWGRNLTDEKYWVGSFDAPVQDGRMNSYPAEPRTWGVTFRKDF